MNDPARSTRWSNGHQRRYVTVRLKEKHQGERPTGGMLGCAAPWWQHRKNAENDPHSVSNLHYLNCEPFHHKGNRTNQLKLMHRIVFYYKKINM